MYPARVGCSGWNYADWRERFYPKGVPPSRWLPHYAKTFDTVEVNSTFYRLASVSACETWVAQTPPDFLFAVKGSRFITHMKRFIDLERSLGRFYERIEPIVRSGKLGPVLWQLPERFHRNDERLAFALETMPPGRHCFEFRHPSWFCDEVLDLLRAHDAALVIGDHPDRPWQPYDFTTGWTFVRFHLGARGRGGNYSRSELEEWAERIDGWRREREVFAYFNNDWKGYAIENARVLKRLLERRAATPSGGAVARPGAAAS